MDTNKLKRFAIEARIALMNGVKDRFNALGFDKDGHPSDMPQDMGGGAVFMDDVVSADFSKKWYSLYHRIQHVGINAVMEEAAYTWFNRFMAIRIMAKQEFIAPVLEYERENVRIPVIVSEARQGRLPHFNDAEAQEKLNVLLDDDSKTDEQFAILIVAFCHDTPVIDKCFGQIADYTELLLPKNILVEGGFLDMLNNSEQFIKEEDYSSPELIGWLYQFYISDMKDAAFAKKGKYEPTDIAPATQIFTPNWIVKYMVQNTVGRIYLDNNPDSDIRESLDYLVKEDTADTSAVLKIEDIQDLNCADLSCGSGHILNEIFSLLYKLYKEEYFTGRNAVKSILEKNIVGIDLDTRAKQLASFALLMKACQIDKSFLNAQVMPRIYDMPRPFVETFADEYSNAHTQERDFIASMMAHFIMGGSQSTLIEIANAIILMNKADTLGSIMKFGISESTRNVLQVRLADWEQQSDIPESIELMMPYVRIILALTDHYAAICMNPPYMGSGKFDETLSKYVKDNYPNSKADLFAVFMDLAVERLKPSGKYGMINMHSWMFLSSFEALRQDVLSNYTIDSMLHLGPRTFDELSGEVVQNTAFVICNHEPKDASATYFRLVDGKNCGDKLWMFNFALDHIVSNVKFENVRQDSFLIIPGYLFGYWFSLNLIKVFEEESLSSVLTTREGMATADNDRFLRLWNEVSKSKISVFNKSSDKWYPYNKGGGNRRWFGLREYVVNWQNDGYEIKHNIDEKTGRVRSHNYNGEFAFEECLTWSAISSEGIAVRYCEDGFLWDSKGACGFSENDIIYCMGLINSKVAAKYLTLLSPTLDIKVGDVIQIPFIKKEVDFIKENVLKNISISKEDWDAHETSWDFKENELLRLVKYIDGETTIEVEGEEPEVGRFLESYVIAYKSYWQRKFKTLQDNECELNRMFIEIYGLQDELSPDVSPSDITILQQGEVSIENDELVWHDDVIMKQLISYAVGCMMGRYSIDKPGLILANQGDGVKEYESLVPDSRFEIDEDGILPLINNNAFADFAGARFKEWLSVIFGHDFLIDNLNYIESCLGKSVDDYFVKDFWKDHKRMYQNRPIYWLYSSPKGAFQCLAYMHRMDAYTPERIRTKYLLPYIDQLQIELQDLMAREASLNTAERKRVDTLNKMIAECRDYHDILHDIADQQIAFDLDDGVLVNYAKFEKILAKLK